MDFQICIELKFQSAWLHFLECMVGLSATLQGFCLDRGGLLVCAHREGRALSRPDFAITSQVKRPPDPGQKVEIEDLTLIGVGFKAAGQTFTYRRNLRSLCNQIV